MTLRAHYSDLRRQIFVFEGVSIVFTHILLIKCSKISVWEKGGDATRIQVGKRVLKQILKDHAKETV